MKRPPVSPTLAGFSLLEVVVAMAITGLGVVTLLEIFGMGLRLGSRSTARTEAVAASRQVFDRILLREEFADGREQGVFAEGYRWSLEIRPFDDEKSLSLSVPWKLKQVTLTFPDTAANLEMRTLRLIRQKDE